MKKKVYTYSHKKKLLNKESYSKRFSAEEKSSISKIENSKILKSKNDVLSSWLVSNYKKLESLIFLTSFIQRNKYKNIVSLGSGSCVLEYFLKLSIPYECKVIASDFDKYLIYNAKRFFPEINTCYFDFFNDSFESAFNQNYKNIDIVFFMGSSYVMDDKEFVDLFSSIKKSGIKNIVDFAGAVIGLREYLRFTSIDFRHKFSSIKKIRNTFTNNDSIRKLFRKKPLSQYTFSSKKKYVGKCHGFYRTTSEYRKLYKKSNLNIKHELSDSRWKYISILE